MRVMGTSILLRMSLRSHGISFGENERFRRVPEIRVLSEGQKMSSFAPSDPKIIFPVIHTKSSFK